MPKRGKLFDKNLTPTLKGIAIILMFAVHLLKTEWMLWPEWIVDFRINGRQHLLC